MFKALKCTAMRIRNLLLANALKIKHSLVSSPMSPPFRGIDA